jgi:hypothetical protein
MSSEQKDKDYGLCELVSPESDTNVNVRVPPASGACAGDISASGTATKSGWTLAQVLVYAKPGHSTITETEIRQGGNAATVDGTDWSSDTVSTAACEGGECGSGDSAVRALAFWERLDLGMPEEDQALSNQANFTGQCTEYLKGTVKKLARPETRCEPRYKKGWHYFTLDPNANGDGNRLVLGDDEDLSASLIECYLEEVDWRIHGDSYGQIDSCLGRWHLSPNPASVRHTNIFHGALVLRQHSRRLVHVVPSEDRRHPVQIRVDPRLRIYAAPNVIRSTVLPHTGYLRLGIRVLQ